MKDQNISVLFDAYNANPSSMNFFLNSCQKSSNQRVLILGDMKELGDKAEEYHQQIGSHPAVLDSRCVFFIGDLLI